jgi:hypothetical protein
VRPYFALKTSGTSFVDAAELSTYRGSDMILRQARCEPEGG